MSRMLRSLCCYTRQLKSICTHLICKCNPADRWFNVHVHHVMTSDSWLYTLSIPVKLTGPSV